MIFSLQAKGFLLWTNLEQTEKQKFSICRTCSIKKLLKTLKFKIENHYARASEECK